MERGFKLFSSMIVSSALFATASIAAGDAALDKVMKERGLSEADVIRAAKTYNPTGVHDKYLMFSSGGQSGQVMVYGVPSMRLLKYIGVFTPEPWQGYGFDEESKKVLEQGKIRGKEITWGDTHHPSLSETAAAAVVEAPIYLGYLNVLVRVDWQLSKVVSLQYLALAGKV